MAKDKLLTWPNKWKFETIKKWIWRITPTKKAEIAENFQDVDKMKLHAEEIKLMGETSLDKAVDMLLKQKEKGKNCFIDFNGVKIYSADTNSVDDAYLQYTWMTKSESDEQSRIQAEERRVSEKRRLEREKWYAKKIEDSREWLEEVKITKENVIAGLKFIAEHPKMVHGQLIDELIKLGCNFTLDDIRKQFPEDGKLFPGMESGHLGCGASVIANYMSSEFWRSYCQDRFLSVDDNTSIYAFIRKVTGDDSYTKEYVDSLVKKEK